MVALSANVVPQLLAARIANGTEVATGDYSELELQVNTAHQNGTFSPQVSCGSWQGADGTPCSRLLSAEPILSDTCISRASSCGTLLLAAQEWSSSHHQPVSQHRAATNHLLERPKTAEYYC